MTRSTSISNVRVFTGSGLSEPRTVLLVDGLIAEIGSEVILDGTVDGTGCTLFPGFIDANMHLTGPVDLETAAQWGVTTALDMGASSPVQIASLRALSAASDIRSTFGSASAAVGTHNSEAGSSCEAIVASPDDAERFVAERVVKGADYISIVVEDPTTGSVALGPATIAALVVAAHKKNLPTVAHASSVPAIQTAVDAWVDVLTPVPVENLIDAELAKIIFEKGMTVIPTLVARRTPGASTPGRSPEAGFLMATGSVAALHAAGVSILVGTGAGSHPGLPLAVSHGAALHEEMELLVEAGISAVEVLRGATSIPASVFGLRDRGRIAPGMRADLVLVEGDPTVTISATRNLRGVWISGERIR